MATRIMPSQEFLREAFDYAPETGDVRWRWRPLHHFVSIGAWKRWNTMYAGENASATAHRYGHRQICLLDQNWPAHRLIWKWMTDEEPFQVDHRNYPTDNSWKNLRATNSTGNNRNRRRLRSHSTGFKGVSLASKCTSRWVAKIRIDGRPTYLGSFDSPHAAHAAYCAAAKQRFGEFWNPG